MSAGATTPPAPRGAPPTRRAPTPNSYWVPGVSLVAGEYPASRDDAESRRILATLLEAGVRVFVDLTTPDDPLEPYASHLAREATSRGIEARHLSMQVRDMGIATPAMMNRILDAIDEHVAAGRTVYLHCWGGVGRTGIVVGCHLVRRGLSGEESLATVRRLFGTMSASKVASHAGRSPQTPAQCEMVRGWAAHDRVLRERAS